MAGAHGQTTDPLIQQLADPEQAPAFDFFWALRRLQCLHPDGPRLGCAESPKDEPVRFGQPPFLIFAPASIQRLDLVEGRLPKLRVYCFGLLGPNGALPLCVTEYIQERILGAKDPTLSAFLDLFQHRMIELFFRAWAVNQKCVDADREGRERFGDYVGSLIGIGLPSLRNRDALPDRSKRYYSGRLATHVRSAEGLEEIVQDYFNVPAAVEQFTCRWIPLPAENQCRLGAAPLTGTLGQSVIVGMRFWDCQLTFTLRLGPMKLADYERLLPGGDSFEQLKCWVLNYAGQEYSWVVQLVLEADEVPPVRLGQAGSLGRTSWLQTRAFDHDADDLSFVVS